MEMVGYSEGKNSDGSSPSRDDYAFYLATQYLWRYRNDWDAAHRYLRGRATHFAVLGDNAAASALELSARIVRFYGRGF